MLAHVGFGYTDKSADTDIKVSYWHIPGGCDYVNARIITCYFADREIAESFCKKHEYPEMACIEME